MTSIDVLPERRNALVLACVNLAYPLSGGLRVIFQDDEMTCLGNRLESTAGPAAASLCLEGRARRAGKHLREGAFFPSFSIAFPTENWYNKPSETIRKREEG